VGVFSKMIVGKLNNALPDEAFLAGLIHDIGILVELQAFREPLVEIAERATRETIRYIDLETQIIGVDHQALGAGLTIKWKFPRSFQYVTGYHHNPMALAQECRWLTMIIHVADFICAREGLGYTLTCKGEALDPGVLEELNLPMDALNELAKTLPEAMKETEALLS
jgi:HD-like signal output (HDOD) protein